MVKSRLQHLTYSHNCSCSLHKTIILMTLQHTQNDDYETVIAQNTHTHSCFINTIQVKFYATCDLSLWDGISFSHSHGSLPNENFNWLLGCRPMTAASLQWQDNNPVVRACERQNICSMLIPISTTAPLQLCNLRSAFCSRSIVFCHTHQPPHSHSVYVRPTPIRLPVHSDAERQGTEGVNVKGPDCKYPDPMPYLLTGTTNIKNIEAMGYCGNDLPLEG